MQRRKGNFRRCRLQMRLLPLGMFLSPVSFSPDITAATAIPVTRYPASAAMWRLLIATRNPDVALSIPTVVAVMPCPVAMPRRWRRDALAYRRRRPNTDDKLCVGYGASGKKGSKGKCQDFTIHGFEFLSFCNLLLKTLNRTEQKSLSNGTIAVSQPPKCEYCPFSRNKAPQKRV
jgi:hypothetical protein